MSTIALQPSMASLSLVGGDERVKFSFVDTFRLEIKERTFEVKSQYASNKTFLRDKIADLNTKDLSSLTTRDRRAFFYSLNACVSLLKSVQNEIHTNKLHGAVGILQRILGWLKNRFLRPPCLEDLIRSINTLAATSGEHFRVHTQATGRFREIVKELKTIAKGSTVPGARILYEPHWKEVTGLNLMIDGKLYSGRINLRYFHLHGANYWEKWKTGVNERGVPYINLYSSESFLNEVVIPGLDKEKKAELIEACSRIVEFYTPEELFPLEVFFDRDGKACTCDGRLNAWTKQIADAHKSGKKVEITFRTFLKTQPIPTEKGLIPIEQTEDQFMYVLTTEGKLYFQKEQKGRAQHVGLSGGQAILAAGELQLNPDSTIAMVNSFSGHYAPQNTQMVSMLRFLGANRVDIDKLTVRCGSPHNFKLMSPEKGKLITAWVATEQVTLKK